MRALAATGAAAVLAQRAGQAAVFRLSQASPRLALTAAALAGYLGLTVPSDAIGLDEVGALLGHVPRNRLASIRRAIYGHTTRTTLFFDLLARGELERLRPCLRVNGFERLHALVAKRAPAILLNWHTGPYRAVGTALYVLGFEPLVMEHHAIPHSVTVPLERVAAAGDTWTATAALKAVLDRLRCGGFVLMAGDGYEGARSVEAEVLGRRLTFRQGLATLVRLSGAPVLPIVASWRGGSIVVTLHPPRDLWDGGDADAVVQACARWLDGYLRAYPEELWPDRMREMLAAPPATGGRGVSYST
jgi:lauroyl/myristoyl acyltransferase